MSARLIKVSSAGELLPADAADWVAVYHPEHELIWTRDVLDCGAVPWQRAVEAASAVTLCGWTDWRAPSHIDYAYLIDNDLYGPVLDTDYFTVADRYQWEWTGTACKPSGCARCVVLDGGYSFIGRQDYRLHARAVRAGQLSGLLGGKAT